MEKCIQLAIESGWNDRPYRNMRNAPENERAGIETHYFDLVLNPHFWQCLGKSLGWRHFTSNCKVTPSHAKCRILCDWQGYMHRFIDHIIEGKPVEEFFNNLTK